MACPFRVFRVVVGLTALLLPFSTRLAGQVKPVERPTIVRAAPPAPAAPDLAIEQVQFAESIHSELGPMATAFVTIRNRGALDALLPAGAALVSGAAPGGLRFSDAVPGALTIKAGETRVVQLRSLDVCSGGWGRAPVTFTVDPAKRVPESNRANNAATNVPTVTDLSAADLVIQSLTLKSGAGKSGGALDLHVMVRNAGTAPAVLCPAVPLLRETQTPVSGKYGLQTLTYAATATPAPPSGNVNVGGSDTLRNTDVLVQPIGIVILPGGTRDLVLTAAYRPGDVAAGMYTWQVLVNPDGRVPEQNRGNNSFAAQLQAY